MDRIANKMRAGLSRWAKDRAGAAAVEYALLIAFIAAVIVGAVTVLGANLVAAFANMVATF